MKSFFSRLVVFFWASGARMVSLTRKSPRVPRVFVIVQLAKLGDIVCTTPMFRAIKHHDPGAKVIVVGNATNAKLLEHHPDVDEYLIFDKDHLRQTARKIKLFHPDAGCLTGPGFYGLALLCMAGVRHITAPRVTGGFCPTQTITYRLLRLLVTAVPHRMGHYAPQEYLNLLGPADIHSTDTTKHLAYSVQGDQKADSLLMEHEINLAADLVVGIAPSVGNKIKRWPSERFAYLAKKLVEQYSAKIVIIGGPVDHAEVCGMVNILRDSTEVVNFSQQLNIDELKALVSKLHLFVAVDTGPIYIAEAFGVPTIDIAGAIDEQEQTPRGSLHVNVVPPYPRMPQLRIMNSRVYDDEDVHRQIESITVDMVMDAFRGLYGTILCTRSDKLFSSKRFISRF